MTELGVALGIDVLVQPYLEETQLVPPFDGWRQLSKGYYIVARHFDWARRPICTFREWLMHEAGFGDSPADPADGIHKLT